MRDNAQNMAACGDKCPRCGAPLVSDDMHIGPAIPPDGREHIFSRRFICGQWDDPASPVYKACAYIQTIQKRYAEAS